MANVMAGRTCLVTGGTSGVGRAIARGLARLGADVLLVSSNGERAARAAADLRRETGGTVESLTADLARMDSVRALSVAFRQRRTVLHVLSLNAAVLPMKRHLTPDGLDSVFATNYLGQFLLARLLTDLLEKSAPARVITVSGTPGSLRRGQIHYDDVSLELGWNPLRATLQAAFAKVVFTFELARRLSGTGVTANTFHPGLVRSNLPRSLPWFLRGPAALAELVMSAECPTGVHLASAPELKDVTGAFFVGRSPRRFDPPAASPEAGKRLWALSEKLAE